MNEKKACETAPSLVIAFSHITVIKQECLNTERSKVRLRIKTNLAIALHERGYLTQYCNFVRNFIAFSVESRYRLSTGGERDGVKEKKPKESDIYCLHLTGVM